jgi:death-on-curing protein
VIYLSLAELLHVGDRTLGGQVRLRDLGLLEAAVARPQATAFGADVHPTMPTKAAALLHSRAQKHALVDVNKRLALAGSSAFWASTAFAAPTGDDQAYQPIMSVASGEHENPCELAAELSRHTEPR